MLDGDLGEEPRTKMRSTLITSRRRNLILINGVVRDCGDC